jgi:hypothetical protein
VINDGPVGAKRRSVAFRLVRALLATLACLYLLAAVAIWYGQTKVLYHPRRAIDVTPANFGLTFDSITLPLNGDRLAGWWVPSKIPHAATLLYLHGNAGNVSVNRSGAASGEHRPQHLHLRLPWLRRQYRRTATGAARLRGRGTGLDVSRSRAPYPASVRDPYARGTNPG